MILAADGFSGRVTFLTGSEKGSGKTSLLNYALGLLRASGERAAFLGIGFDGERRAAVRMPRIACREGEVFVSAVTYLTMCGCWPEVLDVLPGSSALGRLAIVRARRDGEVVLVGSERNAYTAHAIELIRSEGWARTVLVDGAMNRVTQVSAFPGARFVFAVLASPGDLERNAAAVRRLAALARLPCVGIRSDGELPELPELDEHVRTAGLPTPSFAVDGPLTATSLARVPETARTIVVDDFTKVFLDLPGIAAVRRERELAVRAGVEFGGFVVSLRDVSRARFLATLADPGVAEMIAFNPYEVGRAEEGADAAA